MKRSSILALCVVMVVGGGLALARDALAASPKRGGTLTVVHSVDISNFDVQAAPGYEVVWINMNIHNSLLTLDKDLKPVPDLAKRWEVSPDASEFTFHLRAGMRWSDGHPFTADDLMFVFEDCIGNPELYRSPPNEFMINGQACKAERLSDSAVKVRKMTRSSR